MWGLLHGGIVPRTWSCVEFYLHCPTYLHGAQPGQAWGHWIFLLSTHGASRLCPAFVFPFQHFAVFFLGATWPLVIFCLIVIEILGWSIKVSPVMGRTIWFFDPHQERGLQVAHFCVTPNCVYRSVRDSSVRIVTRYGLDGLGTNPGANEIFRTRPDRPCGTSRLVYNDYRVTFPWVKRPGRGVNHLPQSSAEVKERVELCL